MWSWKRPVLVLPRQTLDWQRMTHARYRDESTSFSQMNHFPPEYMSEVAKLWDATFELSFFATRQRMKEIARSTQGPYARRLPRSAVICPIDDDDWYSPTLRSVLRSAPHAPAYAWRHYQFGFAVKNLTDDWIDGLALREPTMSGPLCYSNNYAVSSRLWRTLGSEALYQHYDAEKTLREQPILLLDDALSVANKHPACTVFLGRMLGPEFSSAVLIASLQEYLDRTSTSDSPSWAIPLISATRGWFARVLGSSAA